jgi:hypothetical protein
MDGKKSPPSSSAVPEYRHDSSLTRTIALLVGGCGLAFVIGSWLRSKPPNGYAAFLSAMACFVIGASLGFFGGKKSPAPVPGDPILREFQHDSNVTRTIALSGFGCGLAILFGLWASGILPNGSTISFFALACFSIGALLGFLFGIPRVLQKSSQPDPGQPRPEQGNNLQPRASYQLLVNTNLDDVSDWLTKIVVGVSFVELRKIPGPVAASGILH